MAEKRNPIIVQLPHPGKEHIVEFNKEIAEQLWGSSNIKKRRKKFNEKIECDKENKKKTVFPWNNGEHRRKFISVEGKYIKTIDDESGTDGTLYFWGEWEQPSIVTQIHDVTVDMKKRGYPSYIHEPRLGELDKNCLDMYKRYNSKPNPEKGYQNTDPYVFGDNFYYSCCMQNKHEVLRSLKRGDIIIFYSCGKNIEKEEVRLDTVFVVEKQCFEYGRDKDGLYIIIEEDSKKKRYHYDDIRNKSQVSEKYLNGVLNAIMFGHNAKEEEHVSFVLYSGATKANPVNGMFSYFICKTKEDEGNKGFPRISYYAKSPQDNKYGFSYNYKQAIHTIDFQSLEFTSVQDYWKKLTQNILENGYKLGISAEEPREKNQVTPQKD